MATVRPMLATTGALPHGDDWAYELKWDGVRALLDISAGRLRITSRNGNDVTAGYPELAGLAGEVEDALLDGEIVSLVEGRPSFGALQSRMHTRGGQAASLARTSPVTLLVFDVLRLYGVDLQERPYAERRATLERLELHGPHWAVPPVFDDGNATAAASIEQGLEGVVAKRLSSSYQAGRRSRDWVKVKHTKAQDLIVGGYKPGSGGRDGQIGSLLLGTYQADRLTFAGHVGSGLSDAVVDALGEILPAIRRPTSPFAAGVPAEQAAEAVWCEPVLVVEVRFSEWTPDGRIRHPVFRRLRPEVDPARIVREP
ncbi:MAG: non-homologous end-joining DNA ligase [Actinomycetota bacterium]|nr:non-homologous end-joining DNA ligase [Actinomycetota bacterium]